MSNSQNIAPHGQDLASYSSFIDELQANADLDDSSDQAVEGKKHSFLRMPPPRTKATKALNRTADTDVASKDGSKEAEALLRGVGKYTAISASKSAGYNRVSQYDSGNDADDEAQNRKGTGRPSASISSSSFSSFSSSSSSSASSVGPSASATRGKAKENAGQDVVREGGSRSREEFLSRLKAFSSSA